MATLSQADRDRVYRGVMRFWSSLNESTGGLVKQDIRDAVAATDDWIDTNEAAFNLALPINFRTTATLAQKTMLFCAVAAMRVSAAFASRLFGDLE